MRVAETSKLINEHLRIEAATFPGSRQAQLRPWDRASQIHNPRDGSRGRHSDSYPGWFVLTVNHADFDPEWPITTDWPTVVRGIRRALGRSQADFAQLLDVGRATVERWETGRTIPFRGQALQLLTLVRPQLTTELQAGQALNLAAAVVLPHVTRPTAEYTGAFIAGLLKEGRHDHTDLAPALLNALTDARILVAIDPGGDELKDTYFPLAARLVNPSGLPGWALKLVDLLEGAADDDRALVIALAHRLRAHKGTT